MKQNIPLFQGDHKMQDKWGTNVDVFYLYLLTLALTVKSTH